MAFASILLRICLHKLGSSIVFRLLSHICGLLPFSGTQYLQQSYKVSESFPFKWINKKWREGFSVTAMATSGSKWAIVMSRGAGYSDQV